MCALCPSIHSVGVDTEPRKGRLANLLDQFNIAPAVARNLELVLASNPDLDLSTRFQFELFRRSHQGLVSPYYAPPSSALRIYAVIVYQSLRM